MTHQDTIIPLNQRNPDRSQDTLLTDTLGDNDYGLTSTAPKPPSKLKWFTYIGRGMYNDVKNRLPYYLSDWTDAWNYRVIPATWVSRV